MNKISIKCGQIVINYPIVIDENLIFSYLIIAVDQKCISNVFINEWSYYTYCNREKVNCLKNIENNLTLFEHIMKKLYSSFMKIMWLNEENKYTWVN